MDNSLHFYRLKKVDAEFFRGMDPYERVRLISLPFCFAIGAIKDEGEEKVPAGLLVASMSNETLIVEWLAVTPEYQWNGIGENLLCKAFQIALGNGISTVQTVIMPEYEKEVALKDAEEYFRERLFTGKTEIGGDIEFMLSEAANASFLKKDNEKEGACRFLSDFTTAERKNIINKLSLIDNAAYTYSPELFIHALDTDISVVCLTGSTLEGGILICTADNTIYPLYIYAKSEAVSEAMMKTAIISAEMKYGRESTVFLMMRQAGTENTAEKLIGRRASAHLLTASTKEFEESLDETGDALEKGGKHV